jgi:branched-chain amino acid transport system permease protein
MGIALALMPSQATLAETLFSRLRLPERKNTTRFSSLVTLLVLLILPGFIGPSLSNTFNLMMIYIIMGIGMNVMIGFAGLLDLGYVASFAIGAYTTGILTTPSLLTCGGMDAAAIDAAGLTIQTACTGVMTFWQAWPIAILVSAFTGMALGVPVLRLRGDYLAIVTLGFGEIIQRILVSSTFKPVFGGAQGIANIPVPTLDLTFLNPEWSARLAGSREIYYLFLFTVILVSVVVMRLVNTRLGRAWRALRDDEDVAEAMGIHLVGTKLLAFGISSAFSGMGGALFGASLQGIFPNSFTLLVSINVLSLVIVGGMGAIPGVFIGALMLIGLPEILRELQDYRLLAFGVLLVVAMLSRPQGLIPPQPPRLSEQSTESKQAALAAGD